MLACSTAWNSARHKAGREIIKEILELGINNVELGFSLSESKLDDILSYRKNNGFNISSVHNFCPVPSGFNENNFLPDHFSLSSPDNRERQDALNLTIASMQTAKRAQTNAFIIHAGRVDMTSGTRELIRLYEQGKNNSAEYVDLKTRLINEREEKKQPYFTAIKKSIEVLLKHARSLDLILCIENRFYYREIPSYPEIGGLLAFFGSADNFGYWHDTGHAQVSENLGLAAHLEFLDNYAENLIGIHLHDVAGAKDHLAPLTGNIDFGLLKPYLKKHTIKVLEIHQPAAAAQLKKSILFFRELFGSSL